MPYYRGDYYRGDYYRGDPGLFSFIGKALGTVAKGALGFVTGGPMGAATAVTRSLIPSSGAVIDRAVGAGANAIIPGSGPFATTMMNPFGFGHGGRPAAALPGGGGGGLPMVPGGYGGDLAMKLGHRGMHLNKSTYFSRRAGGLVLKGTNLVKNRRMNPSNGRALHRAARRLHAGIKMYRKIYSLAHGKPMHGKPFPKKRRSHK